MLSRIRRLPSPALVISAIALIVAVGGGTAAIALTDNQKDKRIAKKVANKQITKRAPGLSVKNARRLGGIPASGYTRSACGSLTGQQRGFARINASSTFSSTFTTNGVESPYNCSGGTVEARRTGLGVYEVRFNGSPATLALVQVAYTGSGTPPEFANADVSEESAGQFRVDVFGNMSNTSADHPFVILTP